MQWLNEPPAWSEQDSMITVHSAPRTDFWRVTAQVETRENAHFYYTCLSGNFQLDVEVSGAYTGEWDQAGLMVRASATDWLKCSSEFFANQPHACVVVTHATSDWSIVDLPPDTPSLHLRVTREDTTLAAYYALDGSHYHLLRLAYLPPAESLDAGLYCASPAGPGFTATYRGWRVRDYEGYRA